MTPKEKAKELVESFYRSMFDIKLSDTHIMQTAKQCALICVDEIINSSPSLPILADNGSFGSDIEESTKWWKQVKTEIENL